MSDRPSHEDVEKYVEQLPLEVVDKLPEGDKRRIVKDHLVTAGKLAHELVESAEDAEKIQGAIREGVAWLGTVR